MEEWKDIRNYEGLYQGSSEGRIKSVDRIVRAKSRWGGYRDMLFKGKPLKQFLGDNGYLKVGLSKNGESTSKDVHKLIYEAFYGVVPDGMQVNHIDENKLNNCINNLNLLTPQDNTNYGTAIERMRKTKSKPVFQYTLDYKLVAVYSSTKEAAKVLGFDQASISACARGKKHCKTYKGYIWSYVPL